MMHSAPGARGDPAGQENQRPCAMTNALWQAFNRIFDQPGSLRAVALLRLVAGPIVVVHLWPYFRDMSRGRYYGDTFYDPWVDWLPEAPRGLYFGMLSLCAVTALLMSAGVFTRISTGYTFFFVTYNLFLSETYFRHNRNFLVLNLAVLALLPCGQMFSVDAWWKARQQASPKQQEAPRSTGSWTEGDPTASLWPMYLMRFEVACVYAASGGSKLLNPDWRDGTVTWDRVLWYRRSLEQSLLPEWVIDVVTRHGFHSAFAKVAIATELFLAVGLWFKPTRYWAIYVAVTFHAVIGVALKVQIFSILAIPALMIWVVPRTKDRILTVNASLPSGARLLRWIPRLDWFARFDLRQTRDERAPAATLIERDGRHVMGTLAVREAWLRCPALFPWIAPFVLAARALPQNKSQHG